MNDDFKRVSRKDAKEVKKDRFFPTLLGVLAPLRETDLPLSLPWIRSLLFASPGIPDRHKPHIDTKAHQKGYSSVPSPAVVSDWAVLARTSLRARDARRFFGESSSDLLASASA